MAIQIGAKLDSGFDDPIGMLEDCHRRIEHFLDILCMVTERAHTRSLTGEEQSAIKAALQYFYVGGERHTADEEESLSRDCAEIPLLAWRRLTDLKATIIVPLTCMSLWIGSIRHGVLRVRCRRMNNRGYCPKRDG
jgi:hypothetical protein